MDSHRSRVDRPSGRRDRGLTDAAKAALAALVDAARRLRQSQRRRLGDHISEEADRGNEQEDEDTDPDRRNAP